MNARQPSDERTNSSFRFSIRPAVPVDAERLRAIERDAGELFRSVGLSVIADDEPPSVESLVVYMSRNDAWVAVGDDGEIIGYATASMVDGEAHLDQVSVTRSAAGNRVGVALMETVFDRARQQALSSITLTTFRDVAWNGPYYARHGFSEVEEDDCGPELAKILQDEVAAGIAVSPRIAMRRLL